MCKQDTRLLPPNMMSGVFLSGHLKEYVVCQGAIA